MGGSRAALLLAVLAAIAVLPHDVSTARILAVFPIPGRSHFIVTSSLARELAARGHDVHVISPFKQTTPQNYTDIIITNTINDMGDTNFFDLGNMHPATMYLFMWSFGLKTCSRFLSEPSIQRLINSKDEHFDLILIEAFFNDCFLGFAHKFRAPVVQLCAFGGTTWMNDWVGNPTPYAYVPDPFLDYSHHMTFGQRMVNTVLGSLARIGRNFYYLPRQDEVMRQGFGDADMPYLGDLERNTSVFLVNSHFSMSFPRPAVPAFVMVGGLHIRPPKTLPQDLKSWLDSATDGFIFFSLGSNLRSADMPEHKRKAFIRVFASLKQRVLWKWEEDSLPDQPPNVRLGKWLPQADILAHPKLRLFITHGGLMSCQEAIYHGVPVVGIPIFGDQQLNIARAVAAGYGLSLRFADVEEDTLRAVVQRILDEPAFRENARRLSAQFHDRPLTPMQEAVFWVEYVVRHGGARHLRTAALDLSWIQYLLLDVVAVLLAVAVVLLLAGALLVHALWKRLCASGKKTERKIRRKKD